MMHVLSFLYVLTFIITCLHNKRLWDYYSSRTAEFIHLLFSLVCLWRGHILTPCCFRWPLTSGGDLTECMPTGHSSHLNKSRGKAGPGPGERQPPRGHRRRLLPSPSPLETGKRQVGACEWDMEYIFMLHTCERACFQRPVCKRMCTWERHNF